MPGRIGSAQLVVERFAAELAAAPSNFAVGTSLLFENSSVRVWDLSLGPGERAPFHCHANYYFWTCVHPGRAIQRFADGREDEMEYAVGQTKFIASDQTKPVIHDLENVGGSLLRFITVELLNGPGTTAGL